MIHVLDLIVYPQLYISITCSCHSAKTISPETNAKESPDAVIDELLDIRTQYHDKARNNIHRAQQRQKEYYDSRHDSNHVSYSTIYFL